MKRTLTIEIDLDDVKCKDANTPVNECFNIDGKRMDYLLEFSDNCGTTVKTEVLLKFLETYPSSNDILYLITCGLSSLPDMRNAMGLCGLGSMFSDLFGGDSDEDSEE